MKEANDLVNHQSPRIQNPRKRKLQASEPKGQTGEGQHYHLGRTQTSVSHHHPTKYDQLSHIKLTRGALKEFDRRNNSLPGPSIPTAPGPVENPTEHLPTRGGEISIELKCFARRGGPDISDLKGFPQPGTVIMGGAGSGRKASQASSESSSKRKREEEDSVASTTTIGAYDENSVALFEEHNIHRASNAVKPSHHGDLLAMLAKPHPTLPSGIFGEDKFEAFSRAVEEADSENKVIRDVIPYFTGEVYYPNIMNLKCSNWAAFWDKSPITVAQPDHYDGINIIGAGSEYKALHDQLDKFVVPIIGKPFLPNFFFEFKRPKADTEIVARQAQYEGALGARGMAHVRILNGEDNDDPKAYTFSATYASSTLTLYAHFLKQPDKPGEEWHYHMCRLRSFSISDVVETYLAAATAFRNLRDYAARIRIQLAKEASAKARQMASQGELPPKPAYFLSANEWEKAQKRNDSAEKDKDGRSGKMLPPTATSSGNKRTRK